MLTPAQLRAALALIGWKPSDLAEASGVHRNTINNFAFAPKPSNPSRKTLIAWSRALSRAGVEFIGATDKHGPGVMLRDPKSE
jgi:transcriptional regulator with XRE-family HTH domain